jgi:hypothetical protein
VKVAASIREVLGAMCKEAQDAAEEAILVMNLAQRGLSGVLLT